MLRQFVLVFVAVLLAAGLALFAYDRIVVAPRLAELGETERVSLAEARAEAGRIADELESRVDRSVDRSQVSLDAQVALVEAQAAEIEARRRADAQRDQDELARLRSLSQAAEALARAQMVKVGLAEYRMSMGDWPPDLAAAGLGAPGDHAGGPVAAISLEPQGVIAIRLRDDVAQGAVLRLSPDVNPMGSIEWRCRASGLPAQSTPDACRD